MMLSVSLSTAHRGGRISGTILKWERALRSACIKVRQRKNRRTQHHATRSPTNTTYLQLNQSPAHKPKRHENVKHVYVPYKLKNKEQFDDNSGVELRPGVSQVRFLPGIIANFVTSHQKVGGRYKLTKLSNTLFTSDSDIDPLHTANLSPLVRALPRNESAGKSATGNRLSNNDVSGLVDEHMIRTVLNEVCGVKGLRSFQDCSVINPPHKGTNSVCLYAAVLSHFL
jgi:hypothetical protein